jgi:hypothetical protein
MELWLLCVIWRVAGIETQNDIAMCVPQTGARDVLGRDGSMLLLSSCWGQTRQGWRTSGTCVNLNSEWCSGGFCNWLRFIFGEIGEESEEQVESDRIDRRLRPQCFKHLTSFVWRTSCKAITRHRSDTRRCG